MPKKDSSKCNPLETDENILKELVRLVHGCYEKKSDLINKFNSRFYLLISFPHITKTTIERKLKEITKKDKVNGEFKVRFLTQSRWIVTIDYFEKLVY